MEHMEQMGAFVKRGARRADGFRKFRMTVPADIKRWYLAIRQSFVTLFHLAGYFFAECNFDATPE